MGSRIPLRGMVHRLDFSRLTEGDDGFGGVSLTNVDYQEKAPCRITVMSDEDEREAFGEATGEHWQVIAKYFAGVLKSDDVKVSSTSKPTPLDSSKYYRIIYAKAQIDDHGRFHHWKLFIELKKEDTDS